MVGKSVRLYGRVTWEGHHGIVLNYVPQRAGVVRMLYAVRLKNRVVVHVLRHNMLINDVPQAKVK